MGKATRLAQSCHRKTPSAVQYSTLSSQGTGSGVKTQLCCHHLSSLKTAASPFCPISPLSRLPPALLWSWHHLHWARLGSPWGGMGWVNPTLASHLMPPSPAALEERVGGSSASTLFNCPVPPHPTNPLSLASVPLCVPACHSSSEEIPVYASLPSLRCFPDGGATFPISAISPPGLGHAHPASSISGTAVKNLGHKFNP